MRSLLFSAFFHPHAGGSELHLENLYAKLLEMSPTDEADLICYHEKNEVAREQYRGINVYRVPGKVILPDQLMLPKKKWLKKVLRELLAKNKYDFMVSNTRFFDHSWWVASLAKKHGAKSILIDHVASHPRHKNKLLNLGIAVVDDFIIKKYVPRYDQIVTISEATNNFLLRKLRGVKLARSPLVIPNGIDEAFFEKYKENRERREVPGSDYQYQNGDILVSFVGRLIPHKHADLALEMAKRLASRAHVHFFVAGGGEQAAIFARASNPKNLHYLGKLVRDDVARLLQASDILLHPSTHAEGLPTAILEAGICGCGVIASDNAGTKEIVKDNETGLLMPGVSADELEIDLETYLAQPELIKKYGAALRKLVSEKYTWSGLAEEYRELLLQLLLKK